MAKVAVAAGTQTVPWRPCGDQREQPVRYFGITNEYVVGWKSNIDTHNLAPIVVLPHAEACW